MPTNKYPWLCPNCGNVVNERLATRCSVCISNARQYGRLVRKSVHKGADIERLNFCVEHYRRIYKQGNKVPAELKVVFDHENM